MKLRVEYTGQLRTALGRAQDEFDAPEGISLREFLQTLASRLDGAAAPHVMTASGQLPSGLLIVVNGAAVHPAAAQTTILKAGDEITLLPPIAGG